jgi:hypothetical protein
MQAFNNIVSYFGLQTGEQTNLSSDSETLPCSNYNIRMEDFQVIGHDTQIIEKVLRTFKEIHLINSNDEVLDEETATLSIQTLILNLNSELLRERADHGESYIYPSDEIILKTVNLLIENQAFSKVFPQPLKKRDLLNLRFPHENTIFHLITIPSWFEELLTVEKEGVGDDELVTILTKKNANDENILELVVVGNSDQSLPILQLINKKFPECYLELIGTTSNGESLLEIARKHHNPKSNRSTLAIQNFLEKCSGIDVIRSFT